MKWYSGSEPDKDFGDPQWSFGVAAEWEHKLKSAKKDRYQNTLLVWREQMVRPTRRSTR